MDNFGAIESTDFRVAIINSKRQVNGNLGLAVQIQILSITEGTIGVYSIAVLSLFSSGISVILILMCGIVVSSSPTVYGFLSSRYCSTIYLRSPVQYGSIQCAP